MLSADQTRLLKFTNPPKFLSKITHFIHRNVVWLILATAVLIRLPLAFLPLTYSVTDTWRETDTASIAHNFTDNGNILYPQINWGGNGPGYVEAEFQFYTFIVSKLYHWFGEQVIIGRLVSLLFTVITLAIFYNWVRSVAGSRPALIALAFFALSPLSIRYSVAFMPEATMFMFYVTSLYLFDRWLKHQSLPLLLLTGVSTALMILVKPTSIHLGLIFLILLLRQEGFKIVRRLDLWLFAAVSLVPSILWYLHARDLYLIYGNTFGILSGGDSKIGNLNYWLNPRFYVKLAGLDMFWILTLGGLVPFLIGCGLAIRKRGPLVFILGGIVIPIYYMIVARYAQESWGIQYHIYALPFAALGVGLGFDWLLQQLRGKLHVPVLIRSPYAWGSVLMFIALVVSSALIYKVYLLRPTGKSLSDCAKVVSNVVPEGSLIIVGTTSVSSANGVPNNYQEPNIFFFSHRYGWSLPADWNTPAHVDAYRQDGARYLVMPYDPAAPMLTKYLQNNAVQVGSDTDTGCSIYKFNESG